MESHSTIGGLVDGKPSFIDSLGLGITKNNVTLLNPNLIVYGFVGTKNQVEPFESTRRDNTSSMTK